MFHPGNRAVALCCTLIAALPFPSWKGFTQLPQTAASPTAQISAAPKAAEYGWIEGVVVDRRGKPVDGAYVYAVGDAEGKLPLGGRWPGGTSTTTDSVGKFVLDRVVVDNPVSVWASKESDYYAGGSPINIGLVPTFNTPKFEQVEVKPGQTVTVRLQLAKKAGKIKLYVRDTDTRKLLVDGIFSEWCAIGVPNMTYNCGRMNGNSDYESLVSTDVDHSIRIEAADGLHEQWEYRNPKTGSRFYRARSGKTERVNVYLRKTPWHKRDDMARATTRCGNRKMTVVYAPRIAGCFVQRAAFSDEAEDPIEHLVLRFTNRRLLLEQLALLRLSMGHTNLWPDWADLRSP